MGYNTDFYGQFKLDRPLTQEHYDYLTAFSETRRMKRDPAKAELLKDPFRVAADLPIGSEGEFFTGGVGFMGQDKDDSVIDYNMPPSSQPGLWCQWVPTEPDVIEWDYGEKFYSSDEWIRYIIDKFLIPWGYVLNGEVEWDGEEREDIGMIVVVDNEVTIKYGRIEYY